MKIITNAPILLEGKNGDKTYSRGTQNEYGEGDADFTDYIFTQKESGYYSIDGELYHFNGEENSFSSVEGFVPISVAGKSVISANSDYFFKAEGNAEQVYLGADGEEYYSVDGENFYNAKGEKIKGAFKKVGKGIGKGGRAIGKGVTKGAKAVGQASKWVGAQFKKFIGKLKPKSKEARALAKLDRKNKKKSQADYKKEKADFEKKLKERNEAEQRNQSAKAQGLPIQPLPPTPPPPSPPSNDAGGDKFIDVLPPVENGQKTLPDGSKVAVPNDQTAKGQDGKTYDKKDLEGAGETKIITNEETGQKELAKILDAKDVTTLTTEEGEQFPFKNSDLGEKGMSRGLKIGLIVGGAVLVLGIVGYLIYRSRNKGNKGK